MADTGYEQIKESKEDYIINKLCQIFGVKTKTGQEKMKKSIMDNEENRSTLQMIFLEQDAVEQIFVLCNSEQCVLNTEAPNPNKLKKKGVVILKLTSEAITPMNIVKDLAFMELPRNILEHCYLVYHDIISPITQNQQNQQGWTELVTKDLMEKFNSYIAQIYVMIGLNKGRTLLPLPTHKMNQNDVTPDKDKAHVFETSIMTWMKQIKNVLKLEPEMALKQGKDPGPLVELDFWENKMKNLNSIYDQLQSPEVQSILRFLEENKSTYTKPFDKIQNQVRQARIEANDNFRYLKSLKNEFLALSEGGKDFIEIHNFFYPIMHKILLIWQKSKYYNTPPRLVVLIREICNAIIAKARDFINGPAIFQLIASEETGEACEKLQNTIDICSKFRQAYFEYKQKSSSENQWKLTSNALFVRLDAFLERSEDIKHLTQTIVQFNKLSKIELGGTKGRTLTETVQQISTEFNEAVEAFQAVKYDIMDIDVKEFDDDFYEFRSKIKELERRLASVITQGFDDQDTIYGRFKLLDSFEGLLNRPIITDELEKKHIVLLESYKQDLKIVQSIFLEGKVQIDNMDERAPIYSNLPPIAGALTWCNGLQERIKEPLEKLSSLGTIIIDREEYKDVQKLYASITKSIQEYEQSKVLAWEKEVQANSQEKLKQSLLYKNENGLLKVNFDPALTRLLREVKYFQLLGLQVPPMAAEIYEKNDTFRQQIISLDLIVQNYNEIITTLHPVEEPLVKERIEKIDIALKPGLDQLKWKSPDINVFIDEVKQVVDSTYEIVNKMKDSLKKIKDCLEKINSNIVEKKTRTRSLPPDEFDSIYKAQYQQKMTMIKENGIMTNKLLKEILDAVKIERKLPIWQSYLQYVNEIVLDGIAKIVGTALIHLNDQIDNAYIIKNELVCLFEIRLELGDKDVIYEPIIEESATHLSVRNYVKGWIQDYYLISNLIHRLDLTDASDYLIEIRDFFELKEMIAMIYQNLDWLEVETNTFKDKYRQYSEFWSNDPKEIFQQFLEDNQPADEHQELESPTKGQEQVITSYLQADQNPLLKGAVSKVPNMQLFDEKISALKNTLNEIQRLTPPSVEIGWVKINLQPLKTDLDHKVKSWIRVYTDFLKDQVKIVLKNLTDFINKTNEGIKENPSHEHNISNKELLMSVMKIISDNKDVEPTIESVVKRMKEMVLILKKNSEPIYKVGEEDPIQVIDSKRSQFNETNQRVIKVKQEILPLQVTESSNIKRRLYDFKDKVDVFRQEFLSNCPYKYDDGFKISEIQDSYFVIQKYFKKLQIIQQEQQEYSNLEKLFELEKRDYKPLRDCFNDLKNLKLLWDAIAIVNYQYKSWKQLPFIQIKADILLDQNKMLQLQLKNLPKEIKNMGAPYNAITDKVKNMSVVLPLVSLLHSESMEIRHWDQLMVLTGRKFDHKSTSFNFEEVLQLQLHKHEAAINELVEISQKEQKIEKKLKTIEQTWNKQIFEFEDVVIDEENTTKTFLPLDMMMEIMDAHTMDLMNMRSQGKNVEFFLPLVNEWREKLMKVDQVVNEWLKVQKNWRMLVNIFLKSEDIKQQLAQETQIFKDVDKEFRDLMDIVFGTPAIVENCTTERYEVLKKMNANIKQCEKSLNDYLEQKKKVFPRFYFLSNQALLTILSNGQNLPRVCEFLGDMFDGLKNLVFEAPKPPQEFSKVGTALISKDEEIVNFDTNFEAKGAVELYLGELEFKMREQLQLCLEQAKASSELWDNADNTRDDWLFSQNAQIALLTTQIVWTDDVTKAFDDLSGGSENAMKDCKAVIDERIEALIKQVRKTDLGLLDRWKIINVITIDVHGRDQVESYIVNKIIEAECFAWLSQLKFYFENKESDMAQRQALRFPWELDKARFKCIVKIVDWFRFYSYEYVGNSIRLVVTPLTDRCYITLTQALNLNMGGAPAGPAGTGKTETTKDLGRGVGLYVVVFNCSDQLNKDFMANVFMGLSQSGTWGCFDEFNRISPEVLSVISSQVSCILDALKEKKQKFLFMEDGEINLLDTVGLFITMNPGYAGRSELPENLKALFRSCAMVVPDLIPICENMLLSEGFSTAKELSKKFVTLYQLSKDLLSAQRHYDWGLRAVKSVLRQAGIIKRADLGVPENDLLMRALRDFNIPKIVYDDEKIFLRLINDLFPGCDCPTKFDPKLQKAANETAKQQLGLIAEKQFIVKVVNLCEILQVRHCCFILGSPGAGKTTVWNTLLQTFIRQGQEGEYDTLNPKAVDNSELLGYYTKTKEWKNGVLSHLIKIQSKCEEKYKESHEHKWTILDGDIDPDWIESLNTVMDDNKTLTLLSSDRIALTSSMRLLFEISNLRNATPATVSRAGVLYIDEREIGWGPYKDSWLERSQDIAKYGNREDEGVKKHNRIMINDIGKSVFFMCFQQYIEQNADISKFKYIAPTWEMAKIQSLCCILDALLMEEEQNIKQLTEENQRIAYEAMFIFAGMWAYGGSVGTGQGSAMDDEKDQREFSIQWKAISKIKFPEQLTCYDYYFDTKALAWTLWIGKKQDYVAPEFGETVNFDKIFVHNLSSTRFKYLIDKHLIMKKPILFIGNAGSGKSALIREFLQQTNNEKVQYQTINFNSFTDSLALQRQIWTLLAKKSGKLYGSATQKTLIYFIDDLNMPQTDVWGTQSPIELLNQIINYGSIFNRDFLEERFFLEDFLFFAALNPKAGQFVINQRLQRHFTVLTMYTPSQETIKQIYGQILQGAFDYFGEKIAALAPKLIDATIDLFYKLLANVEFSPTAKKFHYMFNLREISKVTEGLMFAQTNNYKDKPSNMIKLWIHETKRVFEDRLISYTDINQFRIYHTEVFNKHIGDDPSKEKIQEENAGLDPIIFTSFINVHNGGEKTYIESDMQGLKQCLEEKLTEYNEIKSVMNLVLFNQAVQHVSRIARILEFGVGNALLIGVGGSGKQSLAKLAAFIRECEMEQLVVTSNFNLNDLRNILSDVYRRVAKPGSPSRIFMLTDSQIKAENFLIPINDILTQGWIPDLFPKDEADTLIQGVRNEAKGEGVNVNEQEHLNAYFFQKMRNNLKLILCFSPMGENFRKYSRKFPGIINNTSMDWYHAWPKDALLGVAARFMQEVDMPSQEVRQSVVENMTEVHNSIDEANEKFLKLERRHNATTPKSFLELIEFYKKVLGDKRKLIDDQIYRYQQGLNILANTAEKVSGLQEDLKLKMVDVEKQKIETDALIVKVGYESNIAEGEQLIANEEEEKTNVATYNAEKLQKEAEIALSAAVPALKSAEAAINCLKKGHVTEMKNLGQPPMMVRVTAKAVMTLMGEKINPNDDLEKVWKKAGQTMNNPDKFLKSVQTFDGEQIEQAALDATIKVIRDPEVAEKFNPTFMTSQNEAAKYLCAWLVNIIEFNRIFKEVKPLKEKCDAATAEKDAKQAELAIIKEKVRILNEKVSALKKNLEEAEARKAKVEAEANMCMNKLKSAETLVNGLQGENKRWGENVKKLKQNTLQVIGDVLLASSFVSYIGAFTASFRFNLWNKTWLPDIIERKIPISNEITPLGILTTDSQIAVWKNEGLRADQMSLENASIISNCSRWPLLIDPQLQGSTWIKGSLSDRLTVISMSNKKWINILISSIQVGKFVLIEGIQEELDATLDPLLSRAIKKKGNSYQLELGGDPIDYDPAFRLFLMTKLFNPQYRPEVAAQCTIINFIVTESGLQDQLLADVVNIEKAELEEQKSNLVKQQNEFKVILDKLENDLLHTLSEADPNTILEKKELIEQLDDTKKKAEEIERQQIQAKETDIMLNQQREIYRPVANEGALLYFLVISLNYISHMYQYSLESFYTFFFKAITKTVIQDETRIDELIKNIRFTIYQWVSRGLFSRDRLTLLSMICFRLMQKKTIEANYDPTHMEFLIKGSPKVGTENPLDWLPQQMWDNVQGLIQLEEFKSFAQNMEKDAPSRFKDWYNEISPETNKLPLEWKKLESLPFQKLLVLKCLRPDRVTIALNNFIAQTLPDGKSFIEVDQKLSFTEILEASINDSELTTPLFFILTAGSDPVKEVIKIAKKRNMEMGKSFFQMALGQGVEDLAKRRIEEGFKEGHWVMLQNIHLMSRWLKELEKILDNMLSEAGGGNTAFRLFLSAEPQKLVPIGILDRSIKLIQEPPNGLKANMLGAWQYFSKDEIEDKDPKVKSILFALCYFHSVLIERKRFGPKGWNISYPFSIGDLRDSNLVLNKQFEQNQGGKIPFEDFIYIFGDIMYGGHIVDQLDRTLCNSYLRNIMTPQLFEELELFPFVEGKGISFKVPSAGLSYEKYIEYIETQIQQETPLAYGLHPNAEIGFRTNQCANLFAMLMELQPKDEGSGEKDGEIKTPTDITKELIKYILEDKDLKQKIYNLDEIKNKIDEDNKGPYQSVFLQEIECMNALIFEIIRSLDELVQGYAGLLTISDNMELLINSITFNKVPVSWQRLAYPSKRGLASWLENMWKRLEQYDNFKEDPLTPAKVIFINRLFNPQSFLTAVKQIIAQKNQYELNRLYIATDVTRKIVEEIDASAKEGSYVFGFVLEGARWDIQLQQLEESRPKEMFNLMPVTLCKALLLQVEGKEDKSIYNCPAYKTEDRGNTYVFQAQLKTRHPPRKWILAGVAILMDVEGVAEDLKKK